ncbi:MAG: hypothetical protein KDC30_15750, partial [Saprospiraceae bacterium]|nr:hypothetical protein [Saprospiraceae bacterium]
KRSEAVRLKSSRNRIISSATDFVKGFGESRHENNAGLGGFVAEKKSPPERSAPEGFYRSSDMLI